MQLKNLATGVALPLPDDLLWADEHAWSPAVASTSYLITGALLIQSATRQAGRPITLVGAPDMAWVTRAAVEQLRAWAALAVSEATGRFELSFTDAGSPRSLSATRRSPLRPNPCWASRRDPATTSTA